MENINLVIGTYGGHIYVYSFNTVEGEFSPLGKVAANNASYTIGIKGRGIYAVREEGEMSGMYSFMEHVDGALEQTAFSPAPGGNPCFLALCSNGSHIVAADYSGGSISVYPLSGNVVGELTQQLKFQGSGPVTRRQASPHIHQVKHLPPSAGIPGEWILATDLGADRIHLLKVNQGSTANLLEPVKDIECPAGSGPRHMEFSLDGRFLYCIAELSGEILTYEISAQGGIPSFEFKCSTLADEAHSGGSGDIHIHPSGKWLYTSHRLINDGIAIFKVKKNGKLVREGYVNTGNHPRNFMISGCGRFLFVACKNDKCIQVYEIGKNGELSKTGALLEFADDQPSSVVEYV